MGTVVCHEAHFRIECVNYTGDGGGPSGAVLQEKASNRLKLLWLRAMVVSVKEKAGLNLSGER